MPNLHSTKVTTKFNKAKKIWDLRNRCVILFNQGQNLFHLKICNMALKCDLTFAHRCYIQVIQAVRTAMTGLQQFTRLTS